MTDARVFRRFFLCATALFSLFFLVFSSHAEVVRTGYATIVAGNSGKCLDIFNASTAAGSAAVQMRCNSAASDQQWTVSPVGTGFNPNFEIIQQQTGMCLDVYQASTLPGYGMVTNPCTGSPNQLWWLYPVGSSFGLINQKSGLCANVSGTNVGNDNAADNAWIVQSACTYATNFFWSFSSGLLTNANLAVLQAAHSGQCLFVSGASTVPGAIAVQNPCSGSPSEQWILYPYGSGYALLSLGSQQCLTVAGSGINASITQNFCVANTVDLWNLQPVGGSYQIVSQNNSLCLTVGGASQTPGTPLGLSTCGNAQMSAQQDELWSVSNAVLPSSWSSVINLPVDPLSVANLPNGQLLTWSTFDPFSYEGDIEGATSQTYTSIFDPVALTSTETLVSSPGSDMFCPGTANLFDGRILVNGGSSGPKTTIFNPTTGTWSADALMNIPRGYQGDTVLQNGSVLTLGGSWNNVFGGKTAEVWTSGSGWSILSGVPETNILGTDPDGPFRADNHLWLFAAPNGNVFHAGPSAQMNWINTTGAGSITSAGNRGDDPYAVNGKAVLYDVGLIMKTGGAPSYDNSTLQVPSQAGTYTININSGTPVVNKLAPMTYPRAFANGVVLPNGQVVIVGGQTSPAPFSDSNSVLVPEIWDPVTQVFRQLNPMVTPRNYHSTAILLADGRVFVGGGGQCGQGCAANHFNTEILTPPYLLNPDGSAATRPIISAAPATGTLGNTITVTTTTPVTSFVMMRLSSVTHTVNNDQRRVPLTMTAALDGNCYTLSIPSNPGIALQGYYWLFALNAQGVPSAGSTILIN